ncbi:glycoside hydrolase family 3 N-terminal domain-containing protein [Bifidobacterium sp. ESL0745]|uniref:glycoside hydrolase family 3 N-terminal domain-containing protein n=1 Tax=Bifidobacterium sp. ESL0745 TaxID=2983226 RepID=UPI0023F7239B|nr:glycoside hydrolase family 3 N-terminal domain-containing protein [Bifidobacterium sp. ESL0745]MDF7666027.1 glycoside hydrolase family 3 N-terminal domain-containing protein [Bifidobacterium sp. ESL0745]
MLKIQMSDVIAVLHSLIPYLVVIGVLLVAAIIISFAVNKKTVQNVGTRKLVHSESWLVVLIGIVVSVSMMLVGPMQTLLNNTSAKKYELTSATVTKANKLAETVEQEAVTLLQNNDSNLPMSNKNVNVFGWSSTNPIYGGSGSGSMSKQYPKVSMLEGMQKAGLKTNSELSKLYTSYGTKRPEVGMFHSDWSLPEVPVAQYPSGVIDNAKKFSDQAVVVIARTGGEGSDLPTDMSAKTASHKDNSKDYKDFQSGQHFLQLSKTEKDLLGMVTKNFSKVTFVYNGANALQFDFLKEYPQIKSVVWCPPAGQTGFTALGDVLAGKTNPSGKTPDTFVKDLKKTPYFNNFGDFTYNNVPEFQRTSSLFKQTLTPSFVNYVEGIYVGYRFYETASKEGLINYDDVVQYPFGYGLSYTKFEQKMGKVSHSDGKISFDVTVKNTGNKAGKDAVEVYYDPPYTEGGIEKASTNLAAFAKTKDIKPGASQTVKISFKDSDMASYDQKKAKSYVLEKGDYGISLQSDSHHVVDSQTVNIPSTITYNTKSNTHSGDKVAATNQFDDAASDVNYLSRAGHFANYAQATARPASLAMSDKNKAKFVNNGNYKVADHNKSSDKMPTTGAKNNIRLAALRGKSYDDPQWDKLLDQLTFGDMDNLIAMAGYNTPAIKSIGKVQMTDADGPAALNNNFTKTGSIGFPTATSMACTWNRDLARQYGDIFGEMAREMHISGWYGPSMNIHRSAFGGRDFEYFSEDPLISGVLASTEIKAAKQHGVYSFMKHFAMNEQETNRLNMLCEWANEQSIREIYLKVFEMSVKDGGASGAMSAFDYIGPTYCGANSALLNKVLRDEWGFHGFVITDYYGSSEIFQEGNREIRNGNDAMLATMNVNNHISDKSATSVIAMRQATKNILYTTVNSWVYEKGEPKDPVPAWRVAMYVVWAVTAVLVIGLEVLTIMRYMRRRKSGEATVSVDASDDHKE